MKQNIKEIPTVTILIWFPMVIKDVRKSVEFVCASLRVSLICISLICLVKEQTIAWDIVYNI